MRKNTKGSTLVAAIAVIMIIMIILGAALSIASSYYQRSVNENTRRQVYLSAKSSADIVASYISENNEKLIPEQVGEQLTISNIKVDNEINDISGYVLRVDDTTIKIVIHAAFDEITYDIQMIMEQEDYTWTTNSYCEARDGVELC